MVFITSRYCNQIILPGFQQYVIIPMVTENVIVIHDIKKPETMIPMAQPPIDGHLLRTGNQIGYTFCVVYYKFASACPFDFCRVLPDHVLHQIGERRAVFVPLIPQWHFQTLLPADSPEKMRNSISFLGTADVTIDVGQSYEKKDLYHSYQAFSGAPSLFTSH